MQTKRVLAPWYKLVVGLWAVLFLLTTLAYALGAGGVLFTRTGSTVDFNRAADYALLRLNDSLALHVYPAKPGSSVSLARYAPGSLPFSPLLGRYEVDHEVMPVVNYRHGDWLYTGYPQFTMPGQPQAYNVRTNERLRVNGLDPHHEALRLAEVPAFAARGLLGSPADQLPAPAVLARAYPALSVVQESKVVFVGGYLLLGFGLLLLLPFAWHKVPAQAGPSAS